MLEPRECRRLQSVGIGIAKLTGSQYQFAEAPLPARADGVLTVIPLDHGGIDDVGCEQVVEVRQAHRRREKDARLALGAIEFRGDDELGLGQRLRLGETRAPAIREHVAAAIAARAPDTVGVCQGQQFAGGVVRIRGIGCTGRELALPAGGGGLRQRPGIDADAARQRPSAAANRTYT